MQFVKAFEIVLAWIMVTHIYAGNIYTSIQCFSNGQLNLQCNQTSIRIVTANYLFYDCNKKANSCSCLNNNEALRNQIDAKKCDESVYQHKDMTHKSIVYSCSGKLSCDIPLSAQLIQSKYQCFDHSNWFSNHMAISYQCVPNKNILTFCTNASQVITEIQYGFIETRGYPTLQNENDCDKCKLLINTGHITRFKINEGYNVATDFQMTLSDVDNEYELYLHNTNSYVVNTNINITDQYVRSVIITIKPTMQWRMLLYFELNGTSLVTFHCWNKDTPVTDTSSTTGPIVTSTTTIVPDLAIIIGGAVGGTIVLVVVICVIVAVQICRRKRNTTRIPLAKTDDEPQYQDIPDLVANNSAASTQIINGYQNSTCDQDVSYEELPDNNRYNNTDSSPNHEKKDKKTDQIQKSSLTNFKTGSNKGIDKMPTYAKVNKKKKEPTYFELESENTITKKTAYAKVNKRKMEPKYFELEPQDSVLNVIGNEQHDYFELESCEGKKELSQMDAEAEMDHTYFELESGSADGAIHSKLGDTDYAYTYAHFNRYPSEKDSQEHNDHNDGDDKVEFTETDIYNTDKVEFIDNDVYNTS